MSTSYIMQMALIAIILILSMLLTIKIYNSLNDKSQLLSPESGIPHAPTWKRRISWMLTLLFIITRTSFEFWFRGAQKLEIPNWIEQIQHLRQSFDQCPLLITRYLACLVPKRDRQTFLDDLEEEFQTQYTTYGSKAARQWCTKQAQASFWPLLCGWLRRIIAWGVQRISG